MDIESILADGQIIRAAKKPRQATTTSDTLIIVPVRRFPDCRLSPLEVVISQQFYSFFFVHAFAVTTKHLEPMYPAFLSLIFLYNPKRQAVAWRQVENSNHKELGFRDGTLHHFRTNRRLQAYLLRDYDDGTGFTVHARHIRGREDAT